MKKLSLKIVGNPGSRSRVFAFVQYVANFHPTANCHLLFKIALIPIKIKNVKST
jgi:hypothetical protein